MILISPDQPQGTISTQAILSTLTAHASSTALVLLPGIQFYTGQYFDIATISAHAHSLGIPIGWDCAHAAGNVDLRLHDWDVDFAVWCTYKYLNSGPGAIAGLFVHERHGRVDMGAEVPFRPRLCGWWGADKETRFQMENSEWSWIGMGLDEMLTFGKTSCLDRVLQGINYQIQVRLTAVLLLLRWKSSAWRGSNGCGRSRWT